MPPSDRIDSRPHFGAAVAVMARAPSSGKSRLAAALTPDAVRALRGALLIDAVAVAEGSGLPVEVFVTPPAAADEVRALVPGTRCTRQRGDDLGTRMSNAVADLLAAGHDAAIVIGTDIPQLTAADLAEAASLVDSGLLVLGPATDGGYYLLATTAPVPSLFADLKWGTGHVCRDTIVRAEAEGLDVSLLRKLTDVDTPEDLEQVRAALEHEPATVAPAFRRWLAESGHR